MICKNCGKEVAADAAFCTSCGARASGGAAAGPKGSQRTGLVVGAVVAAVVVLAGAGVGLGLGLRGDDNATVPTSVALDGGQATDTTLAATETTVAATETTAGGEEPRGEYPTVVENVLRELDFANGRIPELADMINSTTPDVPQGVMDDLENMRGLLEAAYDDLLAVVPPYEFTEANGHLAEATSRMIRRVQATMDGVQAGWESGSTNAAKPFYSDARHQRDAYNAAIQHFHEYVPVGTLPGD